jgi:hypothetical protein
MRLAKAFALFWWDFVVGDEWRFAVIVCAAAVLGAFAAAGPWLQGRALACALGGGVILAACFVIAVTGRRRSADRRDLA